MIEEKNQTETKTVWGKYLEETGQKEEIAEVADGLYQKTGYPIPVKSFRLILEMTGSPIESVYFWILNHLKQDRGYHHIDKVIDSFSASETSSFFGQSSQRIGIQQDKAGGYLRVISELVKQLFQIVREMRMIDEKLEIRKAWQDDNTGEKHKSADVTIKGEFVELVEGGAKEVNSVYGLAREVGYHILPDLFFNTAVYSIKEIDRKVDEMEYNQRVKNVLKKKLLNFLTWKNQTDKEFKARREFQLKYMYQHWQTIRTYLKWITPYLRNIKRLSMKNKYLESADIISAFETSVVEVEFIAHKEISQGVHSCVLANFYHSTRPEMNFHTQDYSNKGPIHVGKVIVSLKAYAWTEKQIEAYKKYKDEEDLELLGLADQKIESSLEMLGDTFKGYLEECGEKFEKKEEDKPKKPKQDSVISPFLAIFEGFAELGGALLPFSKKEKKELDKKPSKGAFSNAARDANLNVWLTFKIFKKAHQLLSW